MRKEKIKDVQNVALAQWEPDGTISFFLSPQLQALTAEDIHLIKKPFSFPTTIIKEGKINIKELDRLGKDIEWLNKKILLFNVSRHEILLATLENNEELIIYLYEN